jgi:hypothetical protein
VAAPGVRRGAAHRRARGRALLPGQPVRAAARGARGAAGDAGAAERLRPCCSPSCARWRPGTSGRSPSCTATRTTIAWTSRFATTPPERSCCRT